MTLEFTQRTGSDNPLDGVGFEKKSTPAFVDIDNDGDLDAFIGKENGFIGFFENTGSDSSPNFSATADSNKLTSKYK